MSSAKKNIFLYPELWLGSLGYFVDVYDLILFGIVRLASLRSIGVPEADLMSVGALLLNSQMAGMLVGGFLWGVLADRRGRISVLFGSIILYSLANLANGFVTNIESYAILRFIAGVGLAGELGAAVALVTEVLPKEVRGYGSTVIGLAGFCGALLAASVGEKVSWQTAYLIGGALGLLVLAARFNVRESPMLARARGSGVSLGDLRLFFRSAARFRRYVSCVVLGIPIWFVLGILIYFSPELAHDLGVVGAVSAGTAIFWNYAGAIVGDLIGGVLSQCLRSRKKAICFFLMSLAVLVGVYALFLKGQSVSSFYGMCFLLGVAMGYWALFLVATAEQFGTNLRATVATSVPNVVRASIIPMTLVFPVMTSRFGTRTVVMSLGMVIIAVALIALSSLAETFDSNLEYVED